MESPITERHVADSLDSLSRAAGGEVCKLLSAAIESRGRASFVLSGGRTPRSLYTVLAKEFSRSVAWERVDFFWGDERYVPHDDAESNYRLAHEALLQPLGILAGKIHPMPTSPAEPSDAAAFYEKELMDFFGSVDPPFDVLLLGMGADGHVASLFPGSPALLERKRLVVTSEAPNPPRTRLSLTFRAINSAMAILLLIAGGEKKEILSWLDQSEHRKTFPVSRVAGKQRLLWFLDQSAAGLPGSS